MLRKLLKTLSTSAMLNYRPEVISAVLVSLSARPFPLTPGSRSTEVSAAEDCMADKIRKGASLALEGSYRCDQDYHWTDAKASRFV